LSSREAQTLHGIERWLGRAVGDAVQTALAVPEPAGRSEAWSQLVAAYGCRARTAEERTQLAAISGCRFGAPIDELRDVLDAIAKLGRAALAPIGYPDDVGLARRYGRLERQLGELHDEVIPQYRNRVTPKRSMFGQAIAAAKARAGQAPESMANSNRQAFLQRCRTCGGPRLDEHVFECAYCGAHLGAGGT
jgi:hypothetical protein